MESAISNHTNLSLCLLPSSSLTSHLTGQRSLSFHFDSRIGASSFFVHRPAPVVVVARAGSGHCEPSSGIFNTPLEPRSAAGKYLCGVFQNQRQLFHIAVADQLKSLADDRDITASRLLNTSGSDEDLLYRNREQLEFMPIIDTVQSSSSMHLRDKAITQLTSVMGATFCSVIDAFRAVGDHIWRIAGLKEQECQDAVQDVMYMLLLCRFSEIKVPLVPKLSKCVYNGRLEIWPAKDWELESIHNFDVMEMIKEHVSIVIGLRSDSSVTDTWVTTEIQQVQLGQLYAASILYGYYLKSASVRHQLDRSLALARHDVQVAQRSRVEYSAGSSGHSTINSSVLKSESSGHQSLRSYVMGFDAESLKRCGRLKSKEALDLIEKHSSALFGDEKTGLVGSEETIVTSFASMRRLVLEAAAFGTFLWDTEDYVNSVYKLKENN